MELKNIKDSIVFMDSNLTKRVLFANKDVLCFVLNMKPGQTLPVHKHENSTMLLQVISGSGIAKVNEAAAALETGIVLYAKGEDDFSIPTVETDMSMFVILSPNPSNEIYSKNL